MATENYGFDNCGIGELLHRGPLAVPPNQRPYMWGEVQVKNLLADFREAIRNDEDDYFLGTVVLIQKGSETPMIVDGQQRLVTTSVLLARIRDKQIELNRRGRADAIERGYLRDIDIDTEEHVPRLRLNVEDNEFFVTSILPDKAGRSALRDGKLRNSNRRLANASEIAEHFIDKMLDQEKDENQSDYLNRWVEFIKKKASVVVVTATDEVRAFRMFETLNDRGLKAGAADILKNYLFSKSGSRIGEAQMLWNTITSSIEGIGDDEDDRLVTFLRHYWILENGQTKERELASSIRNAISKENRALSFLSGASKAVETYVSLWSSRHPLWLRHRSSTRHSVETIARHLRIEQIRPLMFAVALRFEPDETEKAFRLFVSWSVRFLIYGGRGGMLDEQYSKRAQEVGTGEITKARELRDAMAKYVPTDTEFETAFATARVSRPNLARYYLRSIDKLIKEDPQPEYLANEDAEHITLDHVLPLTPGEGWGVNEDEAEAVQKLLGNLVLLRATQNRNLGNLPFAQRREVYASSGYSVTQMVAEYDKWGPAEIRARQDRLAKLAVKTWPMSFG